MLRRTGAESLDQLQLRLTAQGRLLLTATSANGNGGTARLDAAAGAGLLDGRWHTATVRLESSPADPSGGDRVVLRVEPDGAGVSTGDEASRDDPAGLFRRLNLRGSQLRVGAGLVGCVREGPGVRFTKPGVAVNSFAVRWDACLLPYTCQGKKTATNPKNERINTR